MTDKLSDLLEKIDLISNSLLRGEDEAFDNLIDITEDIGDALELCAKSIDDIKKTGVDISEEYIYSVVDEYGIALNKKDKMYMTDILCFEIYPILNTYRNTI